MSQNATVDKWNENDYVSAFLSDANIRLLYNKGCDTVRQSYKCPNGQLCKDLFANIGNTYSWQPDLTLLKYRHQPFIKGARKNMEERF